MVSTSIHGLLKQSTSSKENLDHDLVKCSSVIWWYHMAIIWLGTCHDIFPKIIYSALICAKSFDISSSTVCQAYNFSERDTFILNLFQRLTAIQHIFIKPSPGTCMELWYARDTDNLFWKMKGEFPYKETLKNGNNLELTERKLSRIKINYAIRDMQKHSQKQILQQRFSSFKLLENETSI